MCYAKLLPVADADGPLTFRSPLQKTQLYHSAQTFSLGKTICADRPWQTSDVPKVLLLLWKNIYLYKEKGAEPLITKTGIFFFSLLLIMQIQHISEPLRQNSPSFLFYHQNWHKKNSQSCTSTPRVWNKLFQAMLKLTGCQKEQLLFCLPRQSISLHGTTVQYLQDHFSALKSNTSHLHKLNLWSPRVPVWKPY